MDTGDMDVEIKTKAVDALFPYQLLWFLISSPVQWEKLGKDWNKFASEPSGTGPFKLARLIPRERAELVVGLGASGSPEARHRSVPPAGS